MPKWTPITLIEVRHRLMRELQQSGLITRSTRIFCEFKCETPASHREFDPEGFWRIGDTRRMSKFQVTVLRELYLWREKLAERKDVPPFKIMHDRELLVVALNPPNNFEDLYNITKAASQNCQSLRQTDAQSCPAGHLQNHFQNAPAAATINPTPSLWNATTHCISGAKLKAQERGVESDIILTKSAMWALAHRIPNHLS